MKALIIGGTGRISHDVSLLSVRQGIETYILNRGNRHHRMPKGASLIVADITNPKEVLSKTKGMSFDVIVDFLTYTPKQLKRNLDLFKNNFKQYIFISSATVYGKKKPNLLITEDTLLSNPVWDYAQNKIRCEQYLSKQCEELRCKYTIVRPYVTYGDTRIPFAVIAKRNHWSLISRILRGKPVVMWDDGNAKCTLTHSSDFAKGVVGLFGNMMALNTAVHITSDEVFTWNEVLSIISKVIGIQPIVVNIPSDFIENEMKELSHELLGDKTINMVFDNSKIKKIVSNFKCAIPFSEGIKQTITFYKNNPEMLNVDYGWDARIDRLICKYFGKHSPETLKGLRVSNITTPEQTIKEKIDYYSERYTIFSFLNYFFRKVPRAVVAKFKHKLIKLKI